MYRNVLEKREAQESVVDKLSKRGMPKHCGLCVNFDVCSKSDPEKICIWIKASKKVFSRFKLGLLFLIFFSFISIAFAAAPTIGTVTPSSGTGTADAEQVFTTTFSDPDGWSNIQYVYFQINTSTGGTNCFYGYYNQNTNKLYLRNDANTSWFGGYAPGSGYVIENSYASLNCAATSVTGAGNIMTVNWAVTLKAPMSGSRNLYLYVRDDTNAYVNWTSKGTWIIPNSAPVNVGVMPLVGASIPDDSFIITSTHQDPNTWLNIQYVYLLINTSTSLTNCIYVYYNQNTNRLYLRNDSNTAWLGGYAPGASNIIENSYVKLSCAQTIVSGSGNQMTVKWALNFKSAFQGAKNIYLYTRDDANLYQNWTQKAVWFAMDSGAVVGVNGGEIVTSDGKAKLVIPAGALSAPTAIKITTVPKEALVGSAPSGTSLLNAVDCKPYGLVFNVPIEIIYSLDQPEIPGTPVELGLYDSEQNKIISTGVISTVSVDGYSIVYPISHFSTYAALKSLIPQGAPIGAGVKIPLPDMFTGAFGHSVPIVVVQGRKNVQPALALSYRSSNPNSWVGEGFSLNPGYIVRSTKLGPPSYNDAADTFYFVTDSGITELVLLVDNLYQAKIESVFSRFYKEPDDSWKVVSKDGSVLRFGQSNESKETSLFGTFSWYLTKAQDTNGNYIEYFYTKDQGKVYLNRIDYTGNENGVSPVNSVGFILESRDDIFSSYISLAKIVTSKRLKEILVKSGGDLAWRYLLEYDYSVDTGRSLLKSIRRFTADGNEFPEINMSYQRSA